MESPAEQAKRTQEDADKRIRAYQALREDIQTMKVTARSADKSVTVTVAPGGALTDLQLTNQAMRHSPARLASLIMSTITEASADAARRMAERVSGLTGPKIDVMGMVEAHLPDLNLPANEERKRP